MIKLKFDASKWQQRILKFEPIARREINKAFVRLIQNARLAMNAAIEDYPSNSNSVLQETLAAYGIEPEPGNLRRSLEDSMDKGTKLRKYRNKYMRKIINYDILNIRTPWNGVNGKRPIQGPANWESNPYAGFGYWKTYNDGFDFGDARIYGRNFMIKGELYIKRNFKKEMRLAIRRIFYHIRK